jgi:hypothetical protein
VSLSANRTSRVRTIAIVLAASLALGCSEGAPSEPPCTHWDEAFSRTLEVVDEVDLLLVSDDSNSVEDWRLLMDELPEMLRALSTGDLDGDGTREHWPVRSIHVGAISTDLGTAGFAVPTCEGVGDDGVLVTTGRTAAPECMASYPTFHVLEPGGGGPPGAGLDWGGCGFEQPLEAALRALSPDTPSEWTIDGYAPPTFDDVRVGRATRENAGFIRASSILAVVVLEDEDDCSASDPSIFDLEDDTLGAPDLRCGEHPELLHAIERYVRGEDGRSGLLGLRRNPSSLVFAVIGGVPRALIGDPGTTDYDAILAHPEMQLRRDPAMPARLAPSCNEPGSGIAFPPRRLVQTAQALEQAGASTTVQSLCGDSLATAAAGVVRAIADRLDDACLPYGLPPEGRDYTQCAVSEILPAGVRCDSRPGVIATRGRTVDSERREECVLRPLSLDEALAGEAGWYLASLEDPVPLRPHDACELTIRRLGADRSIETRIGLYCPRSMGRDGGTCH